MNLQTVRNISAFNAFKKTEAYHLRSNAETPCLPTPGAGDVGRALFIVGTVFVPYVERRQPFPFALAAFSHRRLRAVDVGDFLGGC